MKKRLWYLLLCASTLFFSGICEAQKRNYPKTLLWRITGNKLQKPSYLFGTMHLEDRRLFQFGDSLYHYLENAEGFAMEINPDSAMMAMFKEMSEPDTTKLLKDVLSKREFEKVSKSIQKQYGVSPDKITRKQAWTYAFNRLKDKKPDDMETPVDTYLYNIAKRQGKWVGGIEDLEDQFGLMEQLSAGFDGGELSDDRASKKMMNRMVQVYLAQDLNAINDLSNSMQAEVKEEMLTIRNNKMALRMDSMARIRSNFFAVGAAHLPGDDGLIELLEKKGFVVEPVFSSRKIAPENYSYKSVDLAWNKVEDQGKTFVVEMPGKPYPLEVEGGITMQTYADMGSGLFFLASSVKSHKKSFNPDSVMAGMAKNISGNKKLDGRKIIDLNGVSGIEAFVRNESYFYRLQLFVKSNIIFVLVSGAAKKELLHNNEVNRFHRSLVMNESREEVAPKDNTWKQTVIEKHGFRVEAPGVPERNKNLEGNFSGNPAAANWSINCYTVSDEKTDIFYMMIVRTTKPGYHILNDTTIFEESRRNAENTFADSISLYELFNLQGFPAMRMNANYKENDYVMQSLYVNRGDRSYMMAVIGNKNNDNAKDFNRYLNSFQLTDYRKADWSFKISPDKVFKTWVPSPIVTVADDTARNANSNPQTLLAYDTLTSYGFSVYKEVISPYYWARSDSAFFESYASQYIGLQDSVIEKKSVQNGAIKGIEYFVKSGIISNIKRMRLLPYRDTLFVIVSMIPPGDINDPDHSRFFSEFKFVHDVPGHSYLSNKTSKLLSDLQSTDSTIFQTASAAIESAPFTEEDLPLLHQAMLLPYQDFQESLECTHDKILTEVVRLNSPSTIEFIRDNYSRLSREKEMLKYPLLSVLARIRTTKSYQLFSQLARQQPPLFGNARMLRYYLEDSLLLTATLFPQILQAGTDSTFIKSLPHIVNLLLDSNLLSKKDLEPYAKNFHVLAEGELVRLREAGDYDYLSISLIELLGRLGDNKSNLLLQNFLKCRQLNVKEIAAVWLLKNNQLVDPSQLEKVAADKTYRNSLYSQLLEIGKEKFFPIKYSSQKSIAESDMYTIVSDEYEPSGFQFIGEKLIQSNGRKSKYFLFKISFESDEGQSETYLGVTGPYLNSKQVIVQSEIGGLYTDEPFDARKVEKHLKAYLEKVEKYADENNVRISND